MSFFRDLWSDLVEKRLWPAAAVLLLVLIAVPVALGGGASGDTASAPVAATGAAGAAPAAQVALDVTPPVRRDRAGQVRDPFKQRKLPPAATATVSSVTSATGPTASVDPGTPSVTGGGGGGTTPTPSPTSPPAPRPPEQSKPEAKPTSSYVAVLRLGRTGTKPAQREVERFTPMPSAENPFLVFLGVLSDEKTAVFLLSSDVKATGEGDCKPRASSCQTVELRRGDTEVLDVTGDDGEVTQYELDLVRVTRDRSTAASRAAAARKVSARRAAARRLAAKQADAGDDFGSKRYSYDDETGLLERVKASASLRSADPLARDAAAVGLLGVGATQEPVGVPGFHLGL